MLIRHSRVTTTDGRCTGCLCGAASSRFDYYKHLAELIDELIEDALDAAFGAHARYNRKAT
jgi:hypothetical protein